MSKTENLTLDDAIESGRLDDFVAQAEAEGVAAANVELERPKKKKHWQPKNQFFIVFSPSGETPPVAVHEKHPDALAVAWLMARKHQGQKFFVMGSMSRPCLVEAIEAAPEQVPA